MPSPENPSNTLPIVGELSIATVAEWRERLLAHMAETASLHIDLSGITEMDTMGVQLLLAACRSAREHRLSYSFESASDAVLQACAASAIFLESQFVSLS